MFELKRWSTNQKCRSTHLLTPTANAIRSTIIQREHQMLTLSSAVVEALMLASRPNSVITTPLMQRATFFPGQAVKWTRTSLISAPIHLVLAMAQLTLPQSKCHNDNGSNEHIFWFRHVYGFHGSFRIINEKSTGIYSVSDWIWFKWYIIFFWSFQKNMIWQLNQDNTNYRGCLENGVFSNYVIDDYCRINSLIETTD